MRFTYSGAGAGAGERVGDLAICASTDGKNRVPIMLKSMYIIMLPSIFLPCINSKFLGPEQFRHKKEKEIKSVKQWKC